MTLQPGAVVLLYSDGLVERRGSTIDDEPPGWSSTCASSRTGPSATSATRCSGRMLHGTPEDDVALVAVRIDPQHPSAR